MEEKKKVFIRGRKGCGSAIKSILEGLGAQPTDGRCDEDDCIYFVDHENGIGVTFMDSELAQVIMDNYREIVLPRKEWKDGDVLVIEDGVYIVEKDFLSRRFEDVVGVQNPKECDVMVSYHGHKWVVAKEDLKDDESPLFSDGSHPEDTSSFYKCEIEALNDFDMKSCTEHLLKAGIAFELDADLYIPTAGQLAAMFLFRKELNKALEMVGGTSMKEDVYWSSSENYAWNSWGVNFGSGYVYGWYGRYGVGYVRPCTAFELEKK